jgi:hypothetical protein
MPKWTSETAPRGGARNRLQTKFLSELAKDFEEHGADVIRDCRIEDPIKYLSIIAALMPKDILIQNTVSEMADDEIDILIAQIKERLLDVRTEEALQIGGTEPERTAIGVEKLGDGKQPKARGEDQGG